MCYRGRTNHFLWVLTEGRCRPLCNLEMVPDFPDTSWSEVEEGSDYCAACQKVWKRNLFMKRHPSRDSIPQKIQYLTKIR